jgi:hypothetical protein
MLQSLLPHPECSLCCFLIGIIWSKFCTV